MLVWLSVWSKVQTTLWSAYKLCDLHAIFLFQIISLKKYFYVSCFLYRPLTCGGPWAQFAPSPLKSGPDKRWPPKSPWLGSDVYIMHDYSCIVSLHWPRAVCCHCQFVRFYGTYLSAYLVTQVLMVLSWQLMMLDEKGTVLAVIASCKFTSSQRRKHSRLFLPQRLTAYSTPPLSFLQAGCPSCRPTNSWICMNVWIRMQQQDVIHWEAQQWRQAVILRITTHQYVWTYEYVQVLHNTAL